MLKFNGITKNSPRLACSIIRKNTRSLNSQEQIDLIMRKRKIEGDLSRASNLPVFELKEMCLELNEIENKLGY